MTEEQNQLALDECLGKGWLQVVDEATLDRIRDEVRREQLLGPVYDYPAVDGVDFTVDGAEQWLRISQRERLADSWVSATARPA